MKKLILGFMISAIFIGNVNAETFTFNDSQFKEFIQIQRTNINSSDITIQNCGSNLNIFSKKTYLSLVYNNTSDSGYKALLNDIDEGNGETVKKTIPVMPKLYLGISSNNAIVCEDKYGIMKKIGYAGAKKLLYNKLNIQSSPYITLVQQSYNFITKNKLVDNKYINAFETVLFTNEQMYAYISASSSNTNIYQKNYFNVITSKKYIGGKFDTNNKKAYYENVINTNLAALHMCYTHSVDKKGLTGCIDSFGSDVLSAMSNGKEKYTKLKSKDIK